MTYNSSQHLVHMVRQIIANCGARGDVALAVQKTAEHLTRFWTRAMIRQFVDVVRAGEAGDDTAVAAIAERLSLPDDASHA